MQLKFSDFQETFHLLELPDMDILKENLVIKAGTVNDNAVLCSDSKTFLLKQVISSNSLLIAEQETSQKSYSVLSTLNCYIECVPCLAKVNSLKKYLVTFDARSNNSETIQPIYTRSINQANTLYSFSELESIIQASPIELRTALDSLNSFELDGYLRILSSDYKKWILSLIVSTCLSESISFENIPIDLMYTLLVKDDPTIPFIALQSVLSNFSDSSNEYTLSNYKIARFVAEYILETQPSWSISLFMQEWAKQCPPSTEISPEMLHGIAILEESEETLYLRYFPKSKVLELSNDIRTRFDVLFSIRPKWAHVDILPYILDLVDPTIETILDFQQLSIKEQQQLNKELDGVLIKYSRFCKSQDGQVCYTTRFPISKEISDKVIELNESY